MKACSGNRGIAPLILNSRPGHFTPDGKLPITIEWEPEWEGEL